MEFRATTQQVRTFLDWFEAIHFAQESEQPVPTLSEDDYALAGALYAARGCLPPMRLRHFIPADPPKTLSAGRMHTWLLTNNYKPDDTGTWVSPDVGLDFLPGMWQYCGGTDLGGFKWREEWVVKEGE